eukprot:UN02822
MSKTNMKYYFNLNHVFILRLDEFFKLCDADSKCDSDAIKYIAVHDYEGPPLSRLEKVASTSTNIIFR